MFATRTDGDRHGRGDRAKMPRLCPSSHPHTLLGARESSPPGAAAGARGSSPQSELEKARAARGGVQRSSSAFAAAPARLVPFLPPHRAHPSLLPRRRGCMDLVAPSLTVPKSHIICAAAVPQAPPPSRDGAASSPPLPRGDAASSRPSQDNQLCTIKLVAQWFMHLQYDHNVLSSIL
jgi:hypothetical protein